MVSKTPTSQVQVINPEKNSFVLAHIHFICFKLVLLLNSDFCAFWACYVLNYKIKNCVSSAKSILVFSKSASSQVWQNSTPCGAKIWDALCQQICWICAGTWKFFRGFTACNKLNLLFILLGFDNLHNSKQDSKNFSPWARAVTRGRLSRGHDRLFQSSSNNLKTPVF